MYIGNTLFCTILTILVIVTKGLLVQGNSVNLTESIHGFPGHIVDPADMMQTMKIMMQMLLNQTAEIEHLKQQTEKIENLKLQSENDRSTIQTLQNRVFFLEAGQNELSKLPSSQDFSTYLSGMNHLTQNSVANEVIIRNLTQRLNDAVSALNDLKLKEISTTQQLNGSLVNVVRDVQDLIANYGSNPAFSAGMSSGNSNWNGDIVVFPTIIYSLGAGYNPSTGIFTAPTAGTYVFYVSVQSYYQKQITFDILMNGSRKVRVMTFYNSGSSIGIYQTGTNLVILHLQTGDRVWVKRASGTGYYSEDVPITTFSGFKL